MMEPGTDLSHHRLGLPTHTRVEPGKISEGGGTRIPNVRLGVVGINGSKKVHWIKLTGLTIDTLCPAFFSADSRKCWGALAEVPESQAQDVMDLLFIDAEVGEVAQVN